MHDVPIGSNRSHHNRIGHLIRLVAGIDEARFKRPAPPVAAEWRRLRNPAANARRPMRKGRSGTAAETGLTRCHGQHADGHYACRSGASPCRGRLIRSLPPARPAQPPLKVSGVPPPPQRMLRHDAEGELRVTRGNRPSAPLNAAPEFGKEKKSWASFRAWTRTGFQTSAATRKFRSNRSEQGSGKLPRDIYTESAQRDRTLIMPSTRSFFIRRTNDKMNIP